MKKDDYSKYNIERIVKLYKDEMNFDIDNSKNSEHQFYMNFQSLKKLKTKSDEYNYILFHCLLGPLDYLATMKKSSLADWEIWRKRIINNINNVGLFGDIFELYVNWSLVQKEIEYKKNERPDFTINQNNKEIYIECTSAHFDFDKVPTEKEIFKKLKNNIRSKTVEKYMNSSTALFIDITNLYYHSKKINLTLENEFFFRTLKEIDEDLLKQQINPAKSFGAIYFFCFDYSINDVDDSHYTYNILSKFNRLEADKNLIDFMEKNLVQNLAKKISYNPKFNH